MIKAFKVNPLLLLLLLILAGTQNGKFLIFFFKLHFFCLIIYYVLPAGYLITLKKHPTTLIQNLVHNKVFEMHPSIFSQETIKWKTSTPILAWNL